MGTLVSIDVVGIEPKKARTALDEARGDIELIGREWYPWQNNGELVRLNAALAKGEEAAVTPALIKMVKRSQEIFELSDGLFDPAVAPMVELWGFERAERNPEQAWPSEAQLKAWEADHPTLADVLVDDDNYTIRARRTGVKLDFGAIGKGFAVDIAIDRLRQHGIANALVNAGGNLRAIGHSSSDASAKWRVTIRNPRGDQPLAWLELQDDESVSTSGDYERFAVVDGRRVHHLLDPRTGRPTTHTAAVTVIADDATAADAASTAIFVAGTDGWRETAKKLGIRQVMRVDAAGAIDVTRELAAKLHPAGSEPRQIPWRQVEL